MRIAFALALAVLLAGLSVIGVSGTLAVTLGGDVVGSPMFRVVGNEILGPDGSRFIPEGVNTFDLEDHSWEKYWSHIQQPQMQAAHDAWHSNTVRIQVGTANVLDPAYRPHFLAALDEQVRWAAALRMNVILSDQNESEKGPPMVTEADRTFWKILAPRYRSNQRVWFDAFNEPRLGWTSPAGETRAWQVWRYGGVWDDGHRYLGMQALVDTIRGTGAQNLILAQGPASGERLNRIKDYLLNGPDIVYAVHPYLGPGYRTVQSWDARFGSNSSTLPILVDEWGEYQSTDGECFPDAPSVVPQFLSYLDQHQIGLIGWALYPGHLMLGWDYQVPTAFVQGAYACPQTPLINLNPYAQGAGQLVMAYLAEHSAAPGARA